MALLDSHQVSVFKICFYEAKPDKAEGTGTGGRRLLQLNGESLEALKVSAP